MRVDRIADALERIAFSLEHEHNWSQWSAPDSGQKQWRQCGCGAVQYHDAEPEPPGSGCDHRDKGYVAARMCRSCFELYF